MLLGRPVLLLILHGKAKSCIARLTAIVFLCITRIRLLRSWGVSFDESFDSKFETLCSISNYCSIKLAKGTMFARRLSTQTIGLAIAGVKNFAVSWKQQRKSSSSKSCNLSSFLRSENRTFVVISSPDCRSVFVSIWTTSRPLSVRSVHIPQRGRNNFLAPRRGWYMLWASQIIARNLQDTLRYLYRKSSQISVLFQPINCR